MKRNSIIIVLSILCISFLSACGCNHEWKDATCSEPKTCIKCQKTEGEPLGHSWIGATCTDPDKCERCNKTKGEAKGHNIKDWIVTLEPTCVEKGSQEGKCVTCNQTLTEEIKPTGIHEVTNWSIIVKSICTEE